MRGFTVHQTLTPEAASVVKQAMTHARKRGHAQVTPLHLASVMLASPTGLLRRACLHSHSHPLQCKALELCFNVALNRLPSSSSSYSTSMFGPHRMPQNPSISNALVAAFKRAQAHKKNQHHQPPVLAVKIELERLLVSILDDPSVSRVMREAGFSSIQVKCNVEQALSMQLSSTHHQNPKTIGNPSQYKANHEDVMSVVESLMNMRRRNIVVVGECIQTLEGVINGVMEKVENGVDLCEGLKGVKFINVPLSSFSNIRREEVDQKIGELTCLVKSLASKGVVLYFGDLKWIAEYREADGRRSGGGGGYYCSVEHMVMEIGRLIMCSGGYNNKVWVVGIATFHTFMRCKNGHHSLESVWGLYPSFVPAGCLDLSLNPAERDLQVDDQRNSNESAENGSSLMMLENKQNKHSLLERNLSFPPPSHSSSSFFPHDKYQEYPSLKMHILGNCKQVLPFWSNPNSTPTSPTSSETMETEYVPKFKELSPENMTALCVALEETAPHHKGIIGKIASKILQCRSRAEREETWLFFNGPDIHSKERIAMELSKVVFGSPSKFVSISLSGFCSTSRAEMNKRGRDEQNSSYTERIAREVSFDPHRVFFIEDVDQVDYCSQTRLKRAIDKGKIVIGGGDEKEVSFGDAIIILTCERWFGSKPRACSPPKNELLSSDDYDKEETIASSSCGLLDLNISIDNLDDSLEDLSLPETVDLCVTFSAKTREEEDGGEDDTSIV
ncbi:hypothetical protein DM860_010453 [Cuscuta australis]|uniref:Clp R domain-containing protein n=1 Tax=Cuscuta australis TaxID=267555 RepID=A0A328E182_9ASTE|nr:hypothetical protein DM860_010453 [Cuscuta australis]